jgi:dihydrofolate synthase/folylpolyglutamate synthase
MPLAAYTEARKSGSKAVVETASVTYEEALAYLQSFPDWERGTATNDETYTLDRMRRLLEALDHPDRAYPIVHVVGTKGKGSTAAMLESCLRAAGYRTGLFISPHVVEFRERVQVDGELIGAADFARVVGERLMPAVARLQQAGERRPLHFELLCALAFEHFRQSRVEVAVVEAGLGGRLDATNAVAATALTVLTRIGYDHVVVLGHTLAAIAGEKVAVVRPGGLAVSAEQDPEALAVIERVCLERAAHLAVVGRDWTATLVDLQFDGTTFDLAGPATRYLNLRVALVGAHQAQNAAAAVAALDALRPLLPKLDEAAIRQGLAAVRWPGRLQTAARDPLVLVDAAHNGESAEALAAALRRLYPGRRFVLLVAMFGDKDARAFLSHLAPLSGHVVATSVGHPRSLPADALADVARELGLAVEVPENLAAGLRRARELAQPDGAVVVTGSLRTVGEALADLGIGHGEE